MDIKSKKGRFSCFWYLFTYLSVYTSGPCFWLSCLYRHLIDIFREKSCPSFWTKFSLDLVKFFDFLLYGKVERTTWIQIVRFTLQIHLCTLMKRNLYIIFKSKKKMINWNVLINLLGVWIISWLLTTLFWKIMRMAFR